MGESDHIIIVPPEDRVIVLVEESREIEIPPELRVVEVSNMPIGPKRHTVGNSIRWMIQYGRWLQNAAHVADVIVTSSSATCTIGTHSYQGDDVLFFLTGGILGEKLKVSLKMTDTLDNVKNDEIEFVVTAP